MSSLYILEITIGDNWDIYGEPVESLVNAMASFCPVLEAICQLCGSVDVAVPEDGAGVFSLALQNSNIITEHESAVAVKPVALECGCIVEKTAAALSYSWTLEKIDMVHERVETGTTANRLDND